MSFWPNKYDFRPLPMFPPITETALMSDLCPGNVCLHIPSRISHSLADASQAPEMNVWPSDDKASDITSPVCPTNFVTCRPVSMSQSALKRDYFYPTKSLNISCFRTRRCRRRKWQFGCRPENGSTTSSPGDRPIPAANARRPRAFSASKCCKCCPNHRRRWESGTVHTHSSTPTRNAAGWRKPKEHYWYTIHWKRTLAEKWSIPFVSKPIFVFTIYIPKFDYHYHENTTDELKMSIFVYARSLCSWCTSSTRSVCRLARRTPNCASRMPNALRIFWPDGPWGFGEPAAECVRWTQQTLWPSQMLWYRSSQIP